MARTAGLSVPLLFLLVLAVAATAFLFLMSHQETEAGADNSFEISPASKNIGVASSSSVKLVADPGADSLVVWVVEIAYDPAVVTFNSCTSTGEAQVTACEAKDAGGSPDDDTVVSVGAVLFSDTLRGLEDETALATVKFDAVGAVGECSALTINVTANLGPDPDSLETDPIVTDGEICIVEGTEFTWADTNCQDGVTIADAINVARSFVNLPVDENGCPEIGDPVMVDGTEFSWADTNCQDGVTIADAINIARSFVNLPVDENGCPEIGEVVIVT